MNLIDRPCPHCSSVHTNPIAVYSKELWKIVSCAECEFVYLHNAPDYDTLQNNFEWEASSKAERSLRRKDKKLYYFFSDTLKQIKFFFRKGQRKEIMILENLKLSGKTIDVGCGDGFTLSQMPIGFTPFGVEISKPLAKLANERCSERGGYVINADAVNGLKQFSQNFADLIIMRSYLEHEINPLEVLRSAEYCLKSNGVILIKVPNFASVNRKIKGIKWPGFRFPDHVNYFTPQSLVNMIESASLSVDRFNFLDRIPTSDNMWMLVGKPKA
ncbi:MAG: class I SAM-dependent methyltransferase [Pseudomonadales bacterium]|nr:class I SAM-dependent methyltransferase [Pseudomonadales bacterium]